MALSAPLTTRCGVTVRVPSGIAFTISVLHDAPASGEATTSGPVAVTRDEVRYAKPEPDLFLAAMASTRTPPTCCAISTKWAAAASSAASVAVEPPERLAHGLRLLDERHHLRLLLVVLAQQLEHAGQRLLRHHHHPGLVRDDPVSRAHEHAA